MKKHLLLVAAALFAGASAYAQAIVIDGEAMGLTSSVSEVAEGTVIGSNDAISLSVAFTDSYKVVDLKCNDYTQLVIDGNEIGTSNGIQGNTNPTNAEGTSAATLKAPTAGAVLQIDAKKDGYVVVWGKLSSNKNYTVCEEGSAIGYTLSMQTDDATLGNLKITVAGNAEGYVEEAIAWPEVIATGQSETQYKANGVGVIYFHVYAGCKYLVNACGSKISAGGAYYSESADINVVLKGEGKDDVTLLAAGESSISSVSAASKVAAVKYYNISGQEIKGLAKGINIVKRTMADGSVECVKVLNK
jgi:hypothetical protein